MTTADELEARLKQSAQKLREWNWVIRISTRQAEAVVVLREEARFLIQLGFYHPKAARRIGILIVAYKRLIDEIEQAIAERQMVAA